MRDFLKKKQLIAIWRSKEAYTVHKIDKKFALLERTTLEA